MAKKNDDSFRDLVRSGKADVSDFEELFMQLQKDEVKIDKPDTSDLFTQNIYTDDSHTGDINVNGEWVHKYFQRIVNMLADGEDVVILICGKTGTGKSYTALAIADMMHNLLNLCKGDFDPENQTIYRVIDFLLFIRNATRQVIMFDEAADTLNKNDYHTPFNRAVAGTLNTQRKRQNVYIFIAESLSELDPRILGAKDITIELQTQQNAKVKSYRKKHAKVTSRGKNYSKANFGYWRVPDVPENLQKTYEDIDDKFKGSFLDELLMDVLKKRMESLKEERTASI